MLLRFVAGRAGSGKSTWVYEAVKADLRRSGRPVYIVVPEQYTLQTEKELIEALGGKGFMQARVVSPSRLASEVFSRVEQDRRTAVGECGLAMALRASASRISGKLDAFRSVLGCPGFSIGMVRLISEMKQFDIAPQDMRAASAEARGALKAKARDIAAIYEEYGAYLSARSYMDGEDKFNWFIACIGRAAFLKDCGFYFDGFDSLSPQHCRMVGELMAVAHAVTVTLDYDGFESDDSDLFRAAQSNIGRLSDIARELGAEVKWVHVRAGERQRAMPPGVAHLERSLFAWSGAPAAARGGVTFCRAGDIDEEVEAAAAWIAERVRLGRLHWREVAVQCCDLGAYAPVVARVFGRYGIPAFIDDKKAIVGHPAVRFLLSLVRTAERDFRMDDALRLVKTGYAGVSPEEADRLEMYLAEFSPRGARIWGKPWTKGRDAYDLEAINRCREAVYRPAQALLKHAGGRRAAGSRWARALYALLAEMRLDEALDAEAKRLRRLGLVEESAVTERVWNAALELMDQLDEIVGDEALDVAEFAAVLQSGFESVAEGIIPTGVDQVQVGSMGRSKTSGLKYMLILGASDGSLSGSAEDGGILSSRDVDALAELGVEVGRGSELRASQRRFALYEAVAKGSEGLYVSWPAGAGRDAGEGPDRIVRRAMELLSLGDEDALDAGDIIDSAAAAAGRFGRLPAALRELAGGERMEAAQAAALRWFLDDPAYSGRTRALIAAAAGETPAEYLPAAGILARGAASVTASQLEAYGGCPFRHFVEYGLAPRQWRLHEIEGADAGRFLHAAMEGFARKLSATRYDTAGLDEAGAAALMRAEAERIAAEFNSGVLESTPRLKWTGENLMRVCGRAAATFLRQLKRGAFVPFGQELRFGRLGIPAAALELDDGSVSFLEGRIDRLDVCRRPGEDWLVVVDYKSGRASIDVRDAVNGIDMQTWLYMLALKSMWEKVAGRSARAAGAYIFPLLDPWVQEGPDEERDRRRELRLRGWCLKDGQVMAALDGEAPDGRSELYGCNAARNGGVYGEAAVEKALGLVAGNARAYAREIKRGHVAALPWRSGKDSACAGCGWGALCRFAAREERVYRRLMDDDTVGGLLGQAGEGAGGDALDG